MLPQYIQQALCCPLEQATRPVTGSGHRQSVPDIRHLSIGLNGKPGAGERERCSEITYSDSRSPRIKGALGMDLGAQ